MQNIPLILLCVCANACLGFRSWIAITGPSRLPRVCNVTLAVVFQLILNLLIVQSVYYW